MAETFAGIQSAFEFEGTLRDAVFPSRIGSPSGTLSYVAGKIGQAISFDGANEKFQASPSVNPQGGAGNPFSIEVWLKPSSLVGDQNILGTGSATYAIYLRADGSIAFWDSTAGYKSSSAGVIGTGVWHQAVFTYGDGGATNWKWYVDTVLQGSGSGALAGGGNLFWDWVGNDSTTTKQYLGDIDMLRMWNRAIDTTNISELWNAGAGLEFPGTPVILPIDVYAQTPHATQGLLPLDYYCMTRGQLLVPAEKFASLYDKPSGGSSKFNPGFN